MRIIISVFCFAFIQLASAQDAFIEDFLKKWSNAADYTIEFAEAMPADAYDFKPTEVQMTFGKQLVHIAGNMLWLSQAYLDTDDIDINIDHPPHEKEALINLLKRSFSYAERAVKQLDPTTLNEVVDFPAEPLTKRQIILLLTDHVTHHRGQLVVYLRLNDIEPPRYRGW